MDFNEYQKKAHETAIYPTDITLNLDRTFIYGEGRIPTKTEQLSWIYPTIGLAGESGELLNKLKKVIRDQNGEIPNCNHLSPVDEHICKATICSELGDLLWYIAELCDKFDMTMDYVAGYNIQKLALRAKQNQIKGLGDNR